MLSQSTKARMERDMGFELNGGYYANLYGHSQFPDTGFSYNMGWTCGWYQDNYGNWWWSCW
jgi:hypothetical protein